MMMIKAQEEISKQVREQFPEGHEIKEEERRIADRAALEAVVNAIAEANVQFTHGNYNTSKGETKVDPDPECKFERAINTFIEHLRPKDVIKKGKHFNAQLLVDAFELYDQNFGKFGNQWDSPKNVFFWRKVVGHIQRYLPACYAQVFCQSLWDVVEERQKLNRSLKFKYDRDVSFYPLDSDSRSRLGYDWAARARVRAGGCVRRRRAGAITKLMSSKNSSIANFIQHPNNHPKKGIGCLVM